MSSDGRESYPLVRRSGKLGLAGQSGSIFSSPALGAWIVAAAVLAASGSSVQASEARFLGDLSCGKSACHGGAVPVGGRRTDCRELPEAWRWAWTQWRNRRVDHHSRAFDTLTKPESQAIGRYMGISPTQSPKCLDCHAPAATAAPGSNYRVKDGVTCEHCHGGAEFWREAHSQSDWKQRKQEFVGKGFYDNADPRLRAEKCAQCHVEIDHEILAGGHPPLQFEMVAYAQLMKHWNDSEDRSNGADCLDPSLWSVGQLVGLRRAASMIARRAGDSDYQSLGKNAHFRDDNCYRCHHKLVEDGLRQAVGHYAMSDIVLATLMPGERASLKSAWEQLVSAAATDAGATEAKAGALSSLAGDFSRRVAGRAVSVSEARVLLRSITSSGGTLKEVRRFSHTSSPSSNVETVREVSLPWWYTAGTPEQTVLSVQALCSPAFDSKGGSPRCSGGEQSIAPELRRLAESADRFAHDPAAFSASLGAIHRKLYGGK